MKDGKIQIMNDWIDKYLDSEIDVQEQVAFK